MQNGSDGRGVVTILGGPPAWALGAALPIAAVGLIWRAAGNGGLTRTEHDLVPPWTIAVLTLLVAAGLAWRAVSQRASLSDEGLSCRNLTTSFTVTWDRVDRIEVVRRLGLVVFDVHLTGTRRRHRIGAASRFGGEEAVVVRDLVAALPAASAKLDTDAL